MSTTDLFTTGLDVSGLDTIQFGDEIRQQEFCLRPEAGFLNNGSYGTVPRRILEVQKMYLTEMESHPDHWFRRTLYEKWNAARQAVADFIGAEVEDVVFVSNATAGVNTVIRSFKLEPGDAILASSLTYGSLKNLWYDMQENVCPGIESLFIEIKLPIVSEDELVQKYDDYLTRHPNIKFVLLDHITSPSSMLMPVKRLVEVCHKHGAIVMIDGAHAPGQVPLKLNELDADFYTGNMHKWVYAPRGCAFLWIKRAHHHSVRPPFTSWEKGKSLSWQFFDQGTRDHIPFVCAKHALQFYQSIGGMEKVVGYTLDLATRGRDFLEKELGLECMAIPSTMEAPNLRMLRLPGIPESVSGLDKREASLQLQEDIYNENNIQTIFDWVDGALYLRISVQVHNTIEDIHKLVPVLRQLIATCVTYDKYDLN